MTTDAWREAERISAGVHTFFGIEKGEEDRQQTLQRIFNQEVVSAVLFPHEPPFPPYISSLFVHDNAEHHYADVFLGTVWREDRWPTIEEVTLAVAQWGPAPTMHIDWWNSSEGLKKS
jgi:hypothetical protein